jgi:hypothetical protein
MLLYITNPHSFAAVGPHNRACSMHPRLYKAAMQGDVATLKHLLMTLAMQDSIIEFKTIYYPLFMIFC